MSISEKAVQKLKDDLIRRFLDTGVGFRIVSDGHERISIGLDRQASKDTVVEAGGIRLLVDSSVATLLARYDLDYADGPGGGFCLKSLDGEDPSPEGRAKISHRTSPQEKGSRRRASVR